MRVRNFAPIVVGLVLAAGPLALYLRSATTGHPDHTDMLIASSMASSVENYYSEYGQLPDLPKRWVYSDEEAGRLLLRILAAEGDRTAESQNPRKLCFLSIKEQRGSGGSGMRYGADDAIEGAFDRWGRPFRIVINAGYAKVLEFPHGKNRVQLRGNLAAAWSAGADGVDGTKDDLTSW